MWPAALILAGVVAGQAAPGLTLREAIAEALAASPALQPAQDAVEMAGIQERLSASAFDFQIAPSLQLGARQHGFSQHQAMLTASRRFTTGTDVAISADWLRFGGGSAADRDAGVTFRVSQSLLQAFGPAPRAALTNASRGSASARRAHEEARRAIVMRTADAYFAILRQQLLVDVAEQARARAERLRAAAAARARVELGTELDVMRADLMTTQAEAALAAGREALERARDDLKMLLGRPVGAPLAIDTRDVPDIASWAAAPGAAAIERRFDVQEARARVEDAERAASLARWTALPDVQVTTSYSRRGLAGGASFLNDWLGGWRAEITTSYGMQRGAADAAHAAAGVSVRAAAREAAARAQQAEADVRAAARAVAHGAGAVEIQRKARDIAERQARLAELRYERGLADNLDLIDAEMNLLHAKSALIAARVDHALARLALERAAGRLDPDRYLR